MPTAAKETIPVQFSLFLLRHCLEIDFQLNGRTTILQKPFCETRLATRFLRLLFRKDKASVVSRIDDAIKLFL